MRFFRSLRILGLGVDEKGPLQQLLTLGQEHQSHGDASCVTEPTLSYLVG